MRAEVPTCNIGNNSEEAKVLRECCLIVWDECTMTNKGALEALNWSLKGIGILLFLRVYNGTRIVIKSLTPHLIEATIVTGWGRGKNVFISSMQLYPSGSDMPLNFRRWQFPVRPCFAMSINKSQSQTLSVAGIHLGFSMQSG
uniref:ATP-dependent DNA helicase n=1 Tax=Octopus bimaculoides TaxID=37653 RepID=A0A0L8GV01_OCTBM